MDYKLAVVIPIFNDWEGAQDLLRGLDASLPRIQHIESLAVFLVDDGSTSMPSFANRFNLNLIRSIEVVRLGCNLGHQRAIAVGLSEVVSRSRFDLILVMYGDGEDRPADAITLFNEWRSNKNAVIVARRSKRN